jgi:hypothetical protein
MWDIKHPGPRAIHQITAKCYSQDSPVTPMTRHITKPTPLPAVVKWPGKLEGRSNHPLECSLKPFLPYLEENHTPGYSLPPFFFCTDEGKVSESVILLYFLSKNLLFAKH